MIPPPTRAAKRISQQKIPASPALPREPSEEEVDDYEKRLELTHRRDKQTVPAPHKRRTVPRVEEVHRSLRSIVRSIVAETIEGRTDLDTNIVVYDTIKAFEDASDLELTNSQRDRITEFLYDFIDEVKHGTSIAEAKKEPPYRWVRARDLKPGDTIDVYAGTDKGQERGSRT